MARIIQVDSRFLLLFTGQLVSVLGSSAATFALTFEIFSRTGSTAQLAIAQAAITFGTIYLAPMAGSISDHFARRSVLISCNTILAILAMSMAGLSQTAALSTPIAIAPVLLVNGAVSACVTITFQVVIGSIERLGDRTRANATYSVIESAPVIAGPLLGALVFSLGVPIFWVFVADAVSFGISVMAILLTDAGESRPRGVRSLRPFRGARDGIRIIMADADLRQVQLSFMFFNFFNGIAIASVTALLILIGGSFTLGITNAMGGVGLLIGALTIKAVMKSTRPARIVPLSMMLGGLLGRVVLAATSITGAAAFCVFARNLTTQSTNSPLTSLWQGIVDPDVQGAVFGARRLLGQGLYPFAQLMGGLIPVLLVAHSAVSHDQALRLVLATAGVMEIVIAIFLMRSRAVNRLDQRLSTQP